MSSPPRESCSSGWSLLAHLLEGEQEFPELEERGSRLEALLGEEVSCTEGAGDSGPASRAASPRLARLAARRGAAPPGLKESGQILLCELSRSP